MNQKANFWAADNGMSGGSGGGEQTTRPSRGWGESDMITVDIKKRRRA